MSYPSERLVTMNSIEEFLRAKGPFMAGGSIIETVLRHRDEALEAGLVDEVGALEALMLDLGKLLGDLGDPDWQEQWVTGEQAYRCVRCDRARDRKQLASLKDGGLACKPSIKDENYRECLESQEAKAGVDEA